MTECEKERILDLCSTEAEDMTAMHDISHEKWLYKSARDRTSPYSTGDEAAFVRICRLYPSKQGAG